MTASPSILSPQDTQRSGPISSSSLPTAAWMSVRPGHVSARPSPNATYWDPARETASRKQREFAILERIREMLVYVFDRTPFYRALYEQAGLAKDDLAQMPSLADFTARVPIVTKDMLRSSQERHPPLGDYLAVDQTDLKRIQGTSGTTRQPTLLALTEDDWQHVAESQAMQMWAAGLRPHDIVQVALPLGLYVGGWGLLSAAEHIGAVVLPAAGESSRRQFALMQRAASTVLCTTPSYALRLIESARSHGENAAQSSWRTVFLGGEPGAAIPSVRRRIQEGLGARVVDFGNVAELHPCSNMECVEGRGMHVYQDVVYTEIVDPERPSVGLPMGREGALVYTHLWRQAQPMIRYFSGDRSLMSDAPCACGRTYPRLPRGVIGRLDDQINLRGVKFYPSDVEHVVRSVAGAGSEFQMVRYTVAGVPELDIRVEADERIAPDTYDRLQAQLSHALRDELAVRVGVQVVAPASLPRAQFKARRLIDADVEELPVP